ncbi:ralA-binding protein 1-like isoform X3 [Limulus polyphemus]|uniref:RalA-binding protein 1-like isoform X3 n=1 Tax=Limulus polyphemus TaxID=6850 RepID=A0ABM1S4A8_LIMPO|nr:ralA-binding protein 1-like isoform X3 [Limulus polyphemus]
MDFESPDVEKDFPGLYASEGMMRSPDRDSGSSDDEKFSKKDLIIGKRKDKKDSKKEKGYIAFEGESSDSEMDESRSPGKGKKSKATFFKRDKTAKGKDKEVKEAKKEEERESKKEKDVKESTKKDKETKDSKKKKESKVKLGKSKDKKKKYSDSEIRVERPIFGVPLHVALERNRSHDGIEIPAVVRECIDYIEEHGLSCEGIYQLTGVKSKVQQLRTKLDQGEKVYLYEYEPHIVASLLKQFLRELPEPLLTNELTPKFEDAAGLKDPLKRVEILSQLIENLPTPNRMLLSYMFVHMLHVIQLEKRNKMNLQNACIVLSSRMHMSPRILHALFSHSDVLFKHIEIKKYIPPIRPETSRLSLELPDTPGAIEDELAKQEDLLAQLHSELNAGLRNTKKEEQLWEVQRVVTQLKRKLRFLKQDDSTTHHHEADINLGLQKLEEVSFEKLIKKKETTVEGQEIFSEGRSKEDSEIKSQEVKMSDAEYVNKKDIVDVGEILKVSIRQDENKVIQVNAQEAVKSQTIGDDLQEKESNINVSGGQWDYKKDGKDEVDAEEMPVSPTVSSGNKGPESSIHEAVIVISGKMESESSYTVSFTVYFRKTSQTSSGSK